MSDNVRRLWMKDGGIVELVVGGEQVTLLVQNHDGERAATVLSAGEAGLILAAIAEILPQGGENAMPGVVPVKEREPGEEPRVEHDPMKPWASLAEGMARRAEHHEQRAADLGNGSERP